MKKFILLSFLTLMLSSCIHGTHDRLFKVAEATSLYTDEIRYERDTVLIKGTIYYKDLELYWERDNYIDPVYFRMKTPDGEILNLDKDTAEKITEEIEVKLTHYREEHQKMEAKKKKEIMDAKF